MAYSAGSLRAGVAPDGDIAVQRLLCNASLTIPYHRQLFRMTPRWASQRFSTAEWVICSRQSLFSPLAKEESRDMPPYLFRTRQRLISGRYGAAVRHRLLFTRPLSIKSSHTEPQRLAVSHIADNAQRLSFTPVDINLPWIKVEASYAHTG